MRRVGRGVLVGLGALAVALCLAIVLLPPFLDRIYYRGPVSDHFDGARFFNPGVDDTARPPGGGSRGGFVWRQLTGAERGAWPSRVAVDQSRPPARVAGERMLVTWIGHATVLIQTNGLNILTDPIYAEKAGPFGLGPRRVAAPGVRFEDLPKIDLIIVSHNHYDHMDLRTLKRLWERDRPLIVTSLGNDALLANAGIPPRPLDGKGGTVALDWGEATTLLRSDADAAAGEGFARVTVVRNHHWGSRWFADRNRALWSAFVIDTPKGGSMFFAGDTGFGDGRWPGEARAAAAAPIRLALIPIGAFRFAPGQMDTASHIGPIQAVEVFRRLGARYAVAIHHATFRLSQEAYDTPAKMLDRVMLCRGLHDFTSYPVGAPIDVPPVDAPRPPLPAVAPPPSCNAVPFAPDLK